MSNIEQSFSATTVLQLEMEILSRRLGINLRFYCFYWKQNQETIFQGYHTLEASYGSGRKHQCQYCNTECEQLDSDLEYWVYSSAGGKDHGVYARI